MYAVDHYRPQAQLNPLGNRDGGGQRPRVGGRASRYGWINQRWSCPDRHADRQAVQVALHAAGHLLHRIGFSPQMPGRRAAERHEKAIAMWRAESCVKVRG
jgi:hypothetical protein